MDSCLYVFVCVFVSLSVCVSISLCVCVCVSFICLSVYLCLYLSDHRPSLLLSFSISICIYSFPLPSSSHPPFPHLLPSPSFPFPLHPYTSSLSRSNIPTYAPPPAPHLPQFIPSSPYLQAEEAVTILPGSTGEPLDKETSRRVSALHCTAPRCLSSTPSFIHSPPHISLYSPLPPSFLLPLSPCR